MHLHIDRSSSVAIYQQIVSQIKLHISTGRLPVEGRLPTVRRLASDLGITRLTVQNAYAELQAAGWIEATVGRGTFVSRQAHPQAMRHSMSTNITPDGFINNLLQVGAVVGLNSLASASPDPRLFPASEFFAALTGLESDLPGLLQYGASEGDPLLRAMLATFLNDRGIHADADDILVTAGVTQGLSLVARTLCQPGDVVLVEEPTYLGMLHTLRVQGVHPIGIPLSPEGGIDLEQLERAVVQQRPRFVYVVPAFQNPSGLCLPADRHAALIDMAERHGFLLVEDDVYARIAYAPAPPALKSTDTSGSVVHIGSFSKLLMPGLRIGYVVAPPPLQNQLASLRRATDLCSPPLLQRALAVFLRNDGIKRHLRRVLPIYQQRRDTLVSALRRHMPEGVSWTEPQGGFCTWLTLPPQGAFADLHQACLHKGWAFSPGEVFMASPQNGRHLRICFGEESPETLTAAIEVLAGLISERLRSASPALTADWRPLV